MHKSLLAGEVFLNMVSDRYICIYSLTVCISEKRLNQWFSTGGSRPLSGGTTLSQELHVKYPEYQVFTS